MRIGRAAPRRLVPRGSIRTRGGRGAVRSRALAAGLMAVGSLTALSIADPATASASTLNGVATLANPMTLAADTSGTSTTQFTVSLPASASCDGDTASSGYHVYSYLVPGGANISSLTFESFPSGGYGFVTPSGTYFGPINTAIGSGQVNSVPGDLEFGPLVSADGIPKSTLLYSGSGNTASGVWEAGLACANGSGVLTDNWNTEVTFVASSSDPNGFVWSAVPGPSGSAPAAFTSTASTTFVEGAAGSFTPTTSGSPTPVVTESGALPPGVTSAGGVLSGTPTATGTFAVTLTATNGIEAPATQHFLLHVVPPAPAVSGIAPTSGPLAGGTSVVISGVDLDSATAVDFGPTPATITADTPTSITATAPPGTAGPVDVTVTTAGGTSSTSPADQFTYGTTSHFTSASSVTLVENVAGSFTPAVTGSPAPTVTEAGTLPAGVTFSGGVLSGTPTVTGSFPITLAASNGIGGTVDQSVTLSVVAIEITTTSLPVAAVGNSYSADLVDVSALSPVKWTVSPKLPKGLKLNKTTGAITGKVSKKAITGPDTITFTVTYKAKKVVVTATQTVSLQVNP